MTTWVIIIIVLDIHHNNVRNILWNVHFGNGSTDRGGKFCCLCIRPFRYLKHRSLTLLTRSHALYLSLSFSLSLSLSRIAGCVCCLPVKVHKIWGIKLEYRVFCCCWSATRLMIVQPKVKYRYHYGILYRIYRQSVVYHRVDSTMIHRIDRRFLSIKYRYLSRPHSLNRGCVCDRISVTWTLGRR